jgi:hypothetical protein
MHSPLLAAASEPFRLQLDRTETLLADWQLAKAVDLRALA